MGKVRYSKVQWARKVERANWGKKRERRQGEKTKKKNWKEWVREAEGNGRKSAGPFESFVISVFYLVGETVRTSLEWLFNSKQSLTAASLHFNIVEVIRKKILQVFRI